ncbi:putative protein tyrosine phosphatase type IVA protein 1 [Monocercomonoides exilis]|uniref:putative protein tyrosine phosphatase type IVA protein 1 n=1 Tax=Monocercomonoides exilis TaxID=2049356 RepID=UPI00355A405C|nr:putative protein tyrosine phosphatase type IVA protein 1 [Monocercomonoides exilis]|eukprot:MONOS_9686.1-p1 / transcript=MONOS_9686.1 / gene=MONOS_9686 / organism=Monocercomonoides_exilis_PA203 / gene_product=protein tyrosine phosphatase type IVA protein 1 / transcript_product=protein tyrosine phosphatase type IVA protein 1 / location=Mono_scaffold00409:23581-24256(-) / protein_length=122 / sequence_SO=supercontig / SO=protein_coding / is_pseudo=false
MYPTENLEKDGVQFHDWAFPDGDSPPPEFLNQWFELLESIAAKKDSASKPTIAVHCSAGLERAPEFVCCALIEFGMDPADALALVRKHRKDALNKKQVSYVLGYKKSKKRKLSLSDGVCCIV